MDRQEIMTAPSFDLTGRQALVTGGAGGIGLAAAEALAACGATVTISDLKEPAAGSDSGFQFKRCDVRDADSIAALAEEIPALDILVNCAGALARHQEYDLATFQRVMDVNLTGTFRVATALVEQLKAGPGCVINVASMYSFFGSPHAPAYGASKAGVRQLTKSLALAWAEHGIRVNAVAPGWIRTELTAAGRADADFNRRIIERSPTGRWGEPQEVAGAVVFLASPAAGFVNGVTLPVDGGYLAV
jgi:NAD(P)-dependent dehydrogenase (short-subunit alcohol dehydrogenase family)